MLASIDSDGNFISSLIKQIPEISEKYEKLFEEAENSKDKLAFPWEETAKKCGIAKEKIDDYFSKYSENERSLASYTTYLQEQNKVIDLQTVKTKALTFAKNAMINVGIAAAFALASNAIGWVVEKIDDYIHRIEIAKESAESFNEEIKQLQTTQSDNAKTISDLNEEYKKLSSGVNNVGDNVNLTTDEYDRYHDITNQIADIMPDLIQGFDAQGNAILTTKGNLADLNEEYKKYKQNEAIELYNAKDEEGNLKRESIFENTENQYKQTSMYDSLSSVERLEYLHSLYQLTLNDAKELSKSTNPEDFYLQELLGEHGFNYLEGFNGIDVSAEEFAKVRESIKSEIDALESDIDTATLQLGQQGLLYAQTLEDFWKLGDNSTHLSSILNNLSSDFIEENELYNEEKFEEFVRNLTSKLADTDVQEAMANLYDVDMNTLAIEDVNEYINTISKLLGVGSGTLQDAFGLNFDDQIQNVKAILTKEDWGKIDDLSLEDLSIANSLEVDEGVLLSWDELISKIESVGTQELFSSFDNTNIGERLQHITDLFNEGSLSHKEYFDALQSEIDNFDASNFTNSIEDANNAAAQFFTDSVQQTASGLSDLINKFDNGEMSVSEYLEGYLAIGETLSTLADNLQENSAEWDKNGNAMSDSVSSGLDSIQSDLDNAMSTIEGYQDSIYSLEQILTGAVKAGSDEFKAHSQVIAQDLANIVANGGHMADQISNTLGTTTSEIAQNLTENVANQELACQAIMGNANIAIQDMATSIGELFDELGNAISNFKVDLTFGVKSIDWSEVNVLGKTLKLPEIKFELGASGESLDTIGSAISKFGKTVASNYTPQTINLEDFHFGNTENGKNRSYTPSSDITKNYEDALDDIKDSASSAKEEFNETVDFFERRAKVLEDNLSLIEKGMENVVGSFAKNSLVNAQLGIVDEQVNNYTDALAMYQEKANQALSKLDSDLQSKIINGEVSLIDFDNEEVVEAMKDYEGWSDKVSECKQKLEELKTTIRELELQKFNNIIEDFTNQFDLFGDSIDLIKGQIGLLEEAGELIGSSYYTKQIEQSEKQLEVLEKQKEAMVSQMADAINSGRIQKGTDEWLEMAQSLTDVETEILDCKTSIEEFNNELLELNWQIFERVQTEIGNINDELSNLVGLFDDFDMSDGKGNWTKEAITTLGLYAQQYETAKYQVQQYSDVIAQLNEDYRNGKYSATEYMDNFAELKQGQWDAINTIEDLEDSIVSLNETRINEEIEGINDEISAYRDLIDAQIELIEETEKLKQKQEELSEKSKTVADIEKQLAAMQNDNTAATVAKRKLLEEELAEAKKDLADTERQYSVDAQKEALKEQAENFEKSKNKEIEQLEESLKDRETLISQSFETVKQNADTVGQEIALIAQEHGVVISDVIIAPWSEGSNAIASYGDTLSVQSSAFISKIMGVESEVYALQAKADTASVAISNMFGQRADNLVNELVNSYNAEWNLNNATNTLQNSLINTLERGYNISSITDSLNSIAEAASGAANSLRDMYSAMNGGGSYTTSSPYSSGNPYQNVVDHAQKTDKASQVNRGKYFVIDNTTGNIVASDIATKAEAERRYGGSSLNRHRYTIKAYAKGGIVSKEDDGVLTPIAKAIGEDTLVAVKYGESILTPIQTETLQKVAKVMDNPEFIKTFNIPSLNLTPPKIPQNLQNSRPNVSLHFDKLAEFNGDFNNIDQIDNRMMKIATKSATKLLDDINRDYRISGK